MYMFNVYSKAEHLSEGRSVGSEGRGIGSEGQSICSEAPELIALCVSKRYNLTRLRY